MAECREITHSANGRTATGYLADGSGGKTVPGVLVLHGDEVPPHLQELMRVCFEQSHYYRQWWYWGGEADLRVNGPKLQLTSIPDAEWATVEAAAVKFWDEVAAESETKAKVVEIFKKYNDLMSKAGRPYRYS